RFHAESVRVVAGRYGDLEAEESAVRATSAWAEGRPQDVPAGAIESWLAWLRYRQGRFRDAAALHLRAAELSPAGTTQRALRLLAAAAALLEVGDFDGARRHSADALALATRARNAPVEARAASLVDTVEYRRGAN